MTHRTEAWAINRALLILFVCFLLALAGSKPDYFGFDGWAGFGALVGGAVSGAAVLAARVADAVLWRANGSDDA
ncbi:MAG: hypothetical protein ACFBRM_05525 [Pikeienuella sp.]